MIPILAAAGWDCAFARTAPPRTRAGKTTEIFFKLITPEFLTILTYTAGSERSADGKPEGAAALVERVGLPELDDRVEECLVVREHRAVGHDGGLQKLANDHRVIGPVQTERRVHYRQHDLQFDAGRHAGPLRPGGDAHPPVEAG